MMKPPAVSTPASATAIPTRRVDLDGAGAAVGTRSMTDWLSAAPARRARSSNSSIDRTVLHRQIQHYPLSGSIQMGLHRARRATKDVGDVLDRTIIRIVQRDHHRLFRRQ